MLTVGTFCMDLYSICRFYKFGSTGVNRGRELENIFHKYCLTRMVPITEYRGTTLLGFQTWSGVPHEVDAAIMQDNFALHMEFKAHDHSIQKDQIMLFNEKSLDYYLSVASNAREIELYRIFVSDSPLDANASRLCYMWNITMVEPGLLPAPTILEYARDPVWRNRLPKDIGENCEMLSAVSRSVNSLLVSQGDMRYIFSPPMPYEIGAIKTTHEETSDLILETIDSYEPLHFENHADKLFSEIGNPIRI